MNKIALLLLFGLAISCKSVDKKESLVITSDIDNFWTAFDAVSIETDSLKQLKIVDSLYVKKGSEGLKKIMEVRNYTSEEYVELINKYPKFWSSIRANTLKAQTVGKELNSGIEKFKAIYPKMKPAKMFFTIGCMRTNGTTKDSSVLIGSELAMADSSTDISEFEGDTKEWLANFFGNNPIDGLVLLNVHEYVHTQQNPIPNELLYRVLYEGIAEFVSVTAMGVPSDCPAVAYGKNNPAVKEIFQKEMFYDKEHEWLWSNYPNEFNMRDLGYYLGYAISELHYSKATDKLKAIEELVDLDFDDTDKIDKLIDATGYFSKPIDVLKKEDNDSRPKILSIAQFENGSENVSPQTKQITIEFSQKLNAHHTGVDYSDLQEKGFPKVSNRYWSTDSLSWTLDVDLQSEMHYKFWITSNFRTVNETPLLPYLIEFKTN